MAKNWLAKNQPIKKIGKTKNKKKKTGKKIGQLKFDYFGIYAFISEGHTRQTQKIEILKLKKKLAKNWLAKNQPIKNFGKTKNIKKIGKSLAHKISKFPHFRNGQPVINHR